MVLQVNKKENIQNLLGTPRIGPQKPVVDTRPFPMRVPGTTPVANYQPFQAPQRVTIRPSAPTATINIPNSQANAQKLNTYFSPIKTAYENSDIGKAAKLINETATNFVKAPVRIGNTIASAVTGYDENTLGIGNIKAYGSETLKGFGVEKPNDIASNAVGGLLTALDLTPLAGFGISKIGKEGVRGVKEVSTAIRDAQKLVKELPSQAEKPGVIQIINNQDGTKRYISPGAKEYTDAVKAIDNSRTANGDANNGIAGIKQPNGDIYHITAKTPSQMEAAGFVPEKPTIPTNISQEMSASAKQARELYKVNPIVKAKNAVVDVYDPYRVAEKSDRAFAKATGRKLNDLGGGERLTQALNKTANSDNIAIERLKEAQPTGKSVFKVIQEYGGNSKKGSEFNSYLIQRRDLRIREQSQGRKALLPQYTDDQLKQSVNAYEAANKSAAVDRRTIVSHANSDLDRAVKAGLIKKSDADFLKQYYGEDYVPIQRAISEYLQRPEISGRSLGSIGRQRIVQQLDGNVDTAVDDTFNSIIQRAKTTEKQINQSEAANIYAKRVLAGQAEGKVLVGAGNKAARKEVRAVQKDVNESLKLTSIKASRAKNPVRKKELIAEKQKLVDAKQINKDSIAQLKDDPTTGKQVISGIENGEPYKIEVKPEVARLMQGLDSRKTSQIIEWATTGQRIFQTTWTGFLNVVFPIKSFLFYDVLPSIANSKYGAKTVFSPTAVKNLVRGFLPKSEFRKELTLAGANETMFSGIPIKTDLTADAIAAKKNIFKDIGYNIVRPKQAIESLDKIGGLLSRASRERNAGVYYAESLKAGKSKQEAIKDAAWAYNNILPNYTRASQLARELNAAIPYFSPSIAGTRSLLQGIRNSPKVALTTIVAGVVGPATAATAYSMMSEEGKAYYKDMIDSKKTYTLDNNHTIVLPGASKDSKTGEWSGILKIPVSPEYRALNQALWRGTYDQLNETAEKEQTSVSSVALSMFDFITGGVRSSSNPIVTTARIASGQSPYSSILDSQPLVSGDIAEKPKSEQVYGTTSDTAKNLSKLTNGALSPIQVDAIIGQFGVAGKVVQNKSGNPLETVGKAFSDVVTGSKGQTDSGKFYNRMDEIKNEIKNSDDKRIFEALHAPKTQEQKDAQKTPDQQAEKYKTFLARPDVLAAEKKLNDYNKTQGKPSNPLFDLTPEQQQKVFRYRGAKDLNAAKQAYDKNGEPLFTSLGLDEKWYQDYRDKEADFYNAIKTSDSGNEDKYPTYSGATKPTPSSELQGKLDYYYTLEKGTGARSAFLKANQDVLDYWNTSEQFTNAERVAMGLKPVSEDSGSGFGGRKSDPTANAYKYALSLGAGGKAASAIKPGKVGAASIKNKKVSVKSKPKVSVRKSLV